MCTFVEGIFYPILQWLWLALRIYTYRVSTFLLVFLQIAFFNIFLNTFRTHILFSPYVVIVHGWIIRFHCQIQCHSIYILWNKYVRVLRKRPFCWTFWSICHTKRILRHERILCVFSNQRFWRRSWHKRCIGTSSWKWLEMPRTRVFISPPDQWLAILQNITIYGSQNWSQCFSLAVITGSLFSV